MKRVAHMPTHTRAPAHAPARARGFPLAFPLPADTKVCLAVAGSKSSCKQKKEVVLNMTFRIVCRLYKLHGVVSRKQTRKAYRSQLLIPLVFVSKVLSAAQSSQM
jgi:hypothetical protein